MPQPILFTLHVEARNKGSAQRLGVPPPMNGYMPLPATKLLITGVTKDSTGAILGSCTVQLYRTSDDQPQEEVISDASTGAYSFSAVGPGQNYYVVAYKAGAPDVAGTTVNTLVGV